MKTLVKFNRGLVLSGFRTTGPWSEIGLEKITYFGRATHTHPTLMAWTMEHYLWFIQIAWVQQSLQVSLQFFCMKLCDEQYFMYLLHEPYVSTHGAVKNIISQETIINSHCIYLYWEYTI